MNLLKSLPSNLFALLTLICFLYLNAAYAKNTAELCPPTEVFGKKYYVSKSGKDYKGDGSYSKPWRTIDFAMYKAIDNSTIIVKPGTYQEQVRLKKTFNKAVLLKSEIPYQAKFQFNARVFAIVGGAKNITIEGFEFTHLSRDAKPVVVHIDGYGSYGTPKIASHITLRNNIIHNSYNNDLLKVNNGAENITIECNLFYNQGDSDEHIDINSIKNAKIKNNIFFNDFAGSDRKVTKKTSSFIVIKDSNGKEDKILGSQNIEVDGNIFLNWQGSHGHGFLLIGEDGKPYYEASNVNIFNNLFIGNSNIAMRSPFAIKGAKNINFYNNTTTGDLPSNAYAIRVNKEKQNLKNENIKLYNNIWSDITGSMGSGPYEKNNDFSDIYFNQIGKYYFNNNLIYNGGKNLPHSFIDAINPAVDPNLKKNSPLLPETEINVLPRWSSSTNKFADGSRSIDEVFMKLIYYHAIPASDRLKYKEDYHHKSPLNDIIGKSRTPPFTLGAFQLNTSK